MIHSWRKSLVLFSVSEWIIWMKIRFHLSSVIVKPAERTTEKSPPLSQPSNPEWYMWNATKKCVSDATVSSHNADQLKSDDFFKLCHIYDTVIIHILLFYEFETSVQLHWGLLQWISQCMCLCLSLFSPFESLPLQTKWASWAFWCWMEKCDAFCVSVCGKEDD